MLCKDRREMVKVLCKIVWLWGCGKRSFCSKVTCQYPAPLWWESLFWNNSVVVHRMQMWMKCCGVRSSSRHRRKRELGLVMVQLIAQVFWCIFVGFGECVKGSGGSLSLVAIHVFKCSGCIMQLPRFATLAPNAACQSKLAVASWDAWHLMCSLCRDACT